ncbi:O-antigen ligase family protein [Nitratireductor basaltis]|uniref:O-antigen polymerase n=1 Tax=Nitratireductor basaltis TaxID=472175 RepID=A0A084UDV1_9HYPH|nr:O-antigen ligase [Nitratireductor basaltis]KFB11137.1 O-antigen polymerase [Nitratireductor basaltis]
MSSIANPRKTDIAPASVERISAQVATVIASVILTLGLVSFRPFQPSGPEGETGGDILNQLGYGSLGVLALAAMVMLVNRRTLSALLSPWWLILLGFVALAVTNALYPSSSMRSAAFTIIGVICMCGVLVIPRNVDAFSRVLAVASLAALAISYYGILFKAGIAIHGGDGFEPQHAGLWRGSFSHKNIAAPVMACISLCGLYLLRRGWRLVGAIILVSALFFMTQTGSKTTLATVPLAIAMVMLPGMIGMRAMAPICVATALIVLALGTLGTVFIEPLKELREAISPDLTFTGRTALWDFMGEHIAERPLTGYGFASFWGTEHVLLADLPFDREWDIRGIVHGHNGYLDLAIIMGLPALAVAIIAFVIAPIRDYVRTPLLRENVLMSEFFMMVLTFTLMNAFLESFFFRRADPVWLFFVLAVFGLRVVARFPIR